MTARLKSDRSRETGAGKEPSPRHCPRSTAIPHVSTGHLRQCRQGRQRTGQAGRLDPRGRDLVSRKHCQSKTRRGALQRADAQRGRPARRLPATIGQAEALEAMSAPTASSSASPRRADRPRDPAALVSPRLSRVRYDYRDTDIEAISGTCSNCGGDVIQRTDDYPEAIRTRLMNYERDTEPLLAFSGRDCWSRSTATRVPRT